MEIYISLFFPNTHTYEKAASIFSFQYNFFGKVLFFLFSFGIYPVSGWLEQSRHHQPSLSDRLSTFWLLYLGFEERKKKQGIVDQPLFFFHLVVIPLLLFF